MSYGYGGSDVRAQALYREQALFGHELLTDTGPTTTERYYALIPIGAATITYTSIIDGDAVIGPQEFPDGFYISGHLKTVTVVGTVFAIKADPNLNE